MLRNKKTDREKKWLALERELDELWKQEREEDNWIEVEPYQRGWYRWFVLKENHKNQKYSREVQMILDKINRREHSMTEKFLTYGSNPVERKHKLLTLTENEYLKLSEHQQSFFQFGQEYNRWARKFISFYEFKYPHYFETHIEPCIITHQWVPNAVIESRMQEIENYFQKHDIRHKLNRLHGFRNGYWGRKQDKWQTKFGALQEQEVGDDE